MSSGTITIRKESIWGKGDAATYDLLDREEITGNWLNLAAGDGRYNIHLLNKANTVIVVDKDILALNRLFDITPKQLVGKLKIAVFDMNEKFPFEDDFFDGVFCTGTLHLFSRDKLMEIFHEIRRVLKEDGKLIFDFATDVRRILPNGELYKFIDEQGYTFPQARKLLKTVFKGDKLKLTKSFISEEEIKFKDISYNFNCNFLLGVCTLSKD